MRTLFCKLGCLALLASTSGCYLLAGYEPDCAGGNDTCETFVAAYCNKEAECGGDFDECVAELSEGGLHCEVASGVKGDFDACIDDIDGVRCNEFSQRDWFEEACSSVSWDRDEQCINGRHVDSEFTGNPEASKSSAGDQCTGVSPQSCGGLIEGNCNTTFGCLWNEFDSGAGICTGAPPPCDYWEEEDDCIFFGCEWAE